MKLNKDLAYVIGFLQTDGSLSSKSVVNGKLEGKGKLEVEISARDADILPKIGAILTDNYHIRERTRDTNFKKNYTCATLRIGDLEVRQRVFDLGVPCGKKSDIIAVPEGLQYSRDYWRGIIDGDGSLGIIANGCPFVSLITTSTDLAQSFEAFLKAITGKEKILARNKRDNAFNIGLLNEDAQKLTRRLYYNGCLALSRKVAKAKEVLAWTRPDDMPKNSFIRERWNDKQDAILLANSNKTAAKLLGRTMASVSIRRSRLAGKQY